MPSESPQYDPTNYVVLLEPSELPLGVHRREPLEYVTWMLGSVVYGRTVAEREQVCEFALEHIHVDWARRDGMPLPELFGLSPRHEALFALLFDPANEQLTLGHAAPGAPLDVAYLDEMSILPEHRGHGLGGLVLEELASHYGALWSAIALRAAPEEPETGEWTDRVYGRPFATRGDAAKKKLRVYWARFGFRPLGKTDFMAREANNRQGAPASLRAL